MIAEPIISPDFTIEDIHKIRDKFKMQYKKGNLNILKVSFSHCGRWDLNPHERNAHKILSLARLPVPTLPLDSRHK